MSTRAKFYVYSKTEFKDTWSIKLSPVIGDTPENKEFFKYTPSGTIEISVRENIAPLFEVGKSYYVDFIPTD